MKQTKKYFHIVITILLVASCKKSSSGSGDYCYTCHVTGGYPWQDRYVDTCVREENDLGFSDANGNDLNHFCTPK